MNQCDVVVYSEGEGWVERVGLELPNIMFPHKELVRSTGPPVSVETRRGTRRGVVGLTTSSGTDPLR